MPSKKKRRSNCPARPTALAPVEAGTTTDNKTRPPLDIESLGDLYAMAFVKALLKGTNPEKHRKNTHCPVVIWEDYYALDNTADKGPIHN